LTTTPRRFDVVGVVERLRASASPIGRVIPMVGLDDVVQILHVKLDDWLTGLVGCHRSHRDSRRSGY